MRILAYPLLFFVVEGLRSEGWQWLNGGWNLTGLAGLIMLHVLAWELHGHQRQRRWILPAVMRHPMLRVVASTARAGGGLVCFGAQDELQRCPADRRRWIDAALGSGLCAAAAAGGSWRNG